MRRSTWTVLILAALAGGGTTVWSLSTLEPKRLDILDGVELALRRVRERPDSIDSWTQVSRRMLQHVDGSDSVFATVLTQAAVAREIEQMVERLGGDWAGPAGAEAMLWYSASHQLALRAGGGSPDFADPVATAARAHAVDLLIEHSQQRPGDMKHWHWNSLAWAWLRSGKVSYAAGALEQAEAALLALPPDTPPTVIQAGVVRLLSCWGVNGLNNSEAQRAAADRLEASADRWADPDAPDAVRAVVADTLIALGDNAGAAAALERRAATLTARAPDADLRDDLLRLSVIAARTGDHDLTRRLLLALANEIDQHGEGNGVMTRNEVGWRLRRADAEADAQRVWTRWLADQERLADERPDAGTLYNLACGYALVGRDDEALDALDRAIDAGWADARHTANDRDLATLHENDRFLAALERMEQRRGER